MRRNLLARYFAKPVKEKKAGSGAAGSPVGSTSVTSSMKMVASHGPGSRLLSRAEMTLHEVQVYLDREGASDLVAELVMKSTLSPNVFMEAVQLGIALLEGGNPVIQRSLFNKLQSAETSPIFFKVFHDKMREAQAEIRSTMSVNTSEMANSSGSKTEDNAGNKRKSAVIDSSNQDDLQQRGKPQLHFFVVYFECHGMIDKCRRHGRHGSDFECGGVHFGGPPGGTE